MMMEWARLLLQSIIALVVLYGAARLLGKRQISELSFFEYIAGITIGDIAASVSLEMKPNWYNGLIALTVWVGIPVLMEIVDLRSLAIRKILDGQARVLIKDGKVLEGNLKKERVTVDELDGLLRAKSVYDISHVKLAELEPDGKLNVLVKAEHQPLTAADLGIAVPDEKPKHTVILDGRAVEQGLNQAGLSKRWLEAKLRRMGVGIGEIFMAEADGSGALYIDRYDDGEQDGG